MSIFHEAFIKLSSEETKEVLDRVNPLLHGVNFSSKTAIVMTYQPSFYPDYYFIDIAEYDAIPPLRRFVLMNEKNITVLNWTNEPIYSLNSSVPISLNLQNVSEYVQFFFSFVKGRHGRFLIIETVDDINWKEDPPPAARKAIGKMLTPMEPMYQENGSFLVKACMMFKDSLFKCDVKVQSDGIVSIMNEELLIEEMPVLDDVFGQ